MRGREDHPGRGNDLAKMQSHKQCGDVPSRIGTLCVRLGDGVVEV